MGNVIVRYPVDVISIVLGESRTTARPVNDDVAFVLASRFNVRMGTEKTERRAHLGGRHLAESADYEQYWLQRLELFERFCIPSVMNLMPRPDVWFIAFGDMESWFIRALLERLRPYPWIRPFFRKKGHPDNAAPLPELLSAFAHSVGKPYVCSTRFDSDDSLHRQFIRGLDIAITRLRNEGNASESQSLSFLYGLMESQGELAVFLRKSNMFLSVFEAVDRIGGPYAVGHDNMRERMPLVEIVTNIPMWMYHRHDRTIEPAWVTGQRLVPLPDPSAILPSFGLTTSDLGESQANPDGSDDGNARIDVSARQTTAEDLRGIAYWDADRRIKAAELAGANGQPTLGRWLDPANAASVDLVQLMHELDSAELPILNGAQLARLARELDETGESVLALRAYDYAVVHAPFDHKTRAERDALATELAARLDFDEQLELSAEAGPIISRPDAVVFVTSGDLDGDEPGALASVLERAGHLAQSGFSVTIEMVACPLPDTPPAGIDGVAIETLCAEPRFAAGSDAQHRELARQLARRISEIGPSLLVADGSSVAQRLAASVGRGLGIPVDFGTGA
jgi:hypothetical protein